jgi:hypothetical protein
MDPEKTPLPIKVTLRLEPDAWHGAATEGIWTSFLKLLGDETNFKAIVKVENIPFHSKSVSLGDKLCLDFKTGVPTIDAIVERGGHSTYQILIEKPKPEGSHLLEALKAMGCDWEWTKYNDGKLYALDVPPEVDLDDIFPILTKAARDENWYIEEGFIGHPPDGQSAPDVPQ